MEQAGAFLQRSIIEDNGVVLDAATQKSILRMYWGLDNNSAEDPDFTTYFAYYMRQCRLFLHHRGRLTTARTHGDLCHIVSRLKNDVSREDIMAEMADPTGSRDQSAVLRTIDLAARLYLMIKFGPDVPHSVSKGASLHWSKGTIGEYLSQHVGVPPVLSCKRLKLPRFFNARNIERIGGLKIEWTTNLVDHLRVLDDDQKVAIFSHASFLRLHRTSGMFPDGFIEETLRTLALLFPDNDRAIRKWLNTRGSEVDAAVVTCGHLSAEYRHIERFVYWRDRLVVLKEVFDEAEPKNLSQWWYDRRRRVQWYTFWIATWVLVLGTLFGVIQIVQGALQVYRAFKT